MGKRISWNKGKKGLQIGWNKGLTKELDNRIMQQSKNMSGKNNPNYGKKLSVKHRQKISNIRIKNNLAKGKNNPMYGKHHSIETKKKLRLARINYIENGKLNGQRMIPIVGKLEKPLLDNLEKDFNCPILRQYYIDGYWLDGYCNTLNIAIEIDEPRHNNPKVKKHDKEKEEYIKEKLKCEFIKIPTK